MKLGNLAPFPIVLMALLAALTFWLERTTQGDSVNAGAKRHDPDFYVDNFVIKRFDLNGNLQHTITAKHMQHYPDDDSTEVTAPDVTYHKLRPTRIVANFANIDSGGKTVVLHENVKAVHTNLKGPDTEITTSVLTVFPDDEIANTDAPVTITQGQSVIHGNGLNTNNKTQQTVLGGRVQGTIAPANK